ncbi:MAG TPA: response regulator [Rugosimonospora sp.]|nr:response regulator [Rugosimonospora sp.]
MTDATAPVRILLVEDQDLNRALVHAIVRRTSQPVIRAAAVTDAADLREARAALAAADFDLILLDVQLPDGSGLSVLEDLAARPERPRPAVIALTGGALPEQHAAAMRAGCDAILDKPFMADDLVSIALRYLQAAPT